MARDVGIEPTSPVLETGVLPLYESRLRPLSADFGEASPHHPPKSDTLLNFFMQCVFFTELAMFFHLQFFLEFFLVSDSEIVNTLTHIAFHFN